MSSGNKPSLAKNTAMLYVLTGSNYVFGIATIPYLTRVLGAEAYGQIGFATAFSSYVQLVLDFGFILSSTEKVAKADGDKAAISRVFTAVCICKLILIALTTFVVAGLLVFVDQFRADPTLFLLYLAYIAVNSFIPDYVYRGMEQMTMVTLRTVIIKFIFLICVFVFIHEPSQYHMVPLFYLLGATFAVLAVLTHMRRKLGIWFAKVPPSYVRATLMDSFQFFVSRIASTFYSSLNMLVLGMIMPGSVTLGHYSACNNVINAGKQVASPVADSLYPYMVRTKKYKVLMKALIVGEVVIVTGSTVVAVFATELSVLIFGAEYYDAGELLRLMAPLIPIAYASYLLGFPALVPMGRKLVANGSVVVGAIVQVVLLIALYFSGTLTATAICCATVATEMVVLLIRASFFAAGFLRMRKDGAIDEN